MSIATEIEDLQTNLEAAKDAVEAKGGTVGDTGLAGLADEIATIPSGSQPMPTYGRITYYWDVNTVYTAEGMMCTVTIVDMDTFGAFYEEAFTDGGMPQIRYENGRWFYYDFEADPPEVEIPDITAIGLNVVFDDPSDPMAEITCGKQYSVNKQSGTRPIDLDTQTSFNALTSVQDGFYDIDGTLVYATAVSSYAFGLGVTAVPNSFLSSSGYSLEELDCREGTNVVSIGNSVRFSNKSFVISLPALETIGNSCEFGGLLDFPSLVTIGNSVKFRYMDRIIIPTVTTIGDYFSAPDSLFVGFENATSVGNNFLQNSNASWIYLHSLQTIGDNFLSGLKNSGPKVNIGNNVVTIGAYFMRYGRFSAIDYAGPTPESSNVGYFRIPSTVTSIGVGFMLDDTNCTSCPSIECATSVFQGDKNAVLSVKASSYTQAMSTPAYAIGLSGGSSIRGTFPSIQSNGYYRKWR